MKNRINTFLICLFSLWVSYSFAQQGNGNKGTDAGDYSSISQTQRNNTVSKGTDAGDYNTSNASDKLETRNSNEFSNSVKFWLMWRSMFYFL